jgi:spore coat protein U-like protein
MTSTRFVKFTCLVLAAALPLGSAPALAEAVCSFNAVGVNFGVYDPLLATPSDSVGTVTVSCTNSPPPGSVTINYAVTLSSGTSGSFVSRRMTSGSSALGYNLYSDAGRALIWGDGGSGTSLVGGSIKVAGRQTVSQDYPVYGRMPAQQDAGPGSYADTIVVTLAF